MHCTSVYTLNNFTSNLNCGTIALQLMDHKNLIDTPYSRIEVLFLNAYDNIKLTGALIDHFYIDM